MPFLVVKKRKKKRAKKKDPAAVALGRRGGIARKAKLSPERRSELARKAALARWARVRLEAEDVEDTGEETSSETAQ